MATTQRLDRVVLAVAAEGEPLKLLQPVQGGLQTLGAHRLEAAVVADRYRLLAAT